MNNVIQIFVVMMITTLSFATAHAKEYIIGISPQIDHSKNKHVVEQLVNNLKAGDTAMIFDAYNLKSVGTITAPTKKIYQNPKVLLQFNKKAVGKLLSFSKGNDKEFYGFVKLPQFLRFIGQNYNHIQDADIVILGAPLYVDITNEKASMQDGRLSYDAYLNFPNQTTIFSTKGKQDYLSGSRVHMGFIDNWAMNDQHALFVKRFWTLFIEGHGAVLSSFTADQETFWNRVFKNAGKLPHDFKVGIDSPHKMQEVNNEKSNIFTRPLAKTCPDMATLTAVKNLEVGIKWDCRNCDLDLYARSHKTAKPLYYSNTKTEEGVFHRDYTQSPESTNGYETISFHRQVDLNKLFLAVNFYSGKTTKPITGEIRIAFNGNTYAMPFTINAKQGNKANGRNQLLSQEKAPSDHWQVLNIKDIVQH